ncbi:MAG TPA: hypothetical protein VJR92_15415 [Gemmatimonadaceae bacterium]|nr:hypothetical protein [Gemmatimonadaceae bacterium]
MIHFLSWFRSRRTDDFADAIHPELRDIPTPPATDALLDRILTSRAAGQRVILPHEAARATGGALRPLMAVAAALVLVVGGFVVLRPTNAEAVLSAPSWFTRPAFAQTTAVVTAAAGAMNAERMHPLTTRYIRTVDGKTVTNIDINVQRDRVNGMDAWRVVATRIETNRSGRSDDTVHIAASDLRLLRVVARQAPYHNFSSIRVAQTIDGLRVYGTMVAERKPGRGAHRTFDRELSRDLLPFVPDAIAPIYMMGVDFTRSWTGRFTLLGWAVRDDDIGITLDLRVDGEETIRVPAGEFECWRIAIDVLGTRQWYWVRKSDGLGIKSRASGPGGEGARENVLVEERR